MSRPWALASDQVPQHTDESELPGALTARISGLQNYRDSWTLRSSNKIKITPDLKLYYKAIVI